MFSFCNSFSIYSFFDLFAAVLLSRRDTSLSKFVFATKFACVIFALITLVAKVLSSEVVIYLS